MAAVVWFMNGQTSTSTAGSVRTEAGAPATASEESSGPAPTVVSPSPSRPPDTAAAASAAEQQALVQLGVLRATSLQRVDLDGRWVAQVASKSVGITDPLQVAANGTHTFYASDILAEIEQIRTIVDPAEVLVLQGTDFGKISVAANGQPYWVTLVDHGFAGSDDILAWCAATFPSLDPEQLANACAVRTLSPPHP